MFQTFHKIIRRAGLAGMIACACIASSAISPEELQRQLAEKAALTVIDVRPQELYRQGHVPGAINIPASLVPEKTLPKLGRAIVYGDGFGPDEQKALQALNAKPGIQAELLEGGYSGWEAAKGATTGNRGLNPEKLQYVTYQQLQDTTSNVVIVDLRKEAAAAAGRLGAASVGAKSSALSDLSKAFPGKPITKSPHKQEKQLGARSVGAAQQPILVLIDNGDGTAQETARELRAQGNTRVLILAGGESTVARQGSRGLQRTGQNLENFNNAIRGGSN
jgi:rhodanese-related sulfurtransferase